MKNLLKEADKITFRVDKRMKSAEHPENLKMSAKKVAATNEILKNVDLSVLPGYNDNLKKS
ncbi:hypothetical protein [Dawidia soli]|uniref:Uncharacterized protein n=1 Tax=Dawidia soli TaxID=2782352 RepID=A0AAP2GH99_9BACT|nr:hypothetical protein [Dawidia soli]MBT1686195.1 hypothetical protein [Dawidia soli]